MKRRGARRANQFQLEPEVCTDGPFKGYSRLDWINSAAKKDLNLKFSHLMHHLSEENLVQAFRQLDGSKAVGIDQVTKSEYQKELRSNILQLGDEIARGGWRPKPSREVLIPKSNGGTRPLAIGCLEDKIVQNLVAKVLEALYEPKFHGNNYGFRPAKSTHHALVHAYQAIGQRAKSCTVVEMDIEKFFNMIDHDKLMSFIEKRISDNHFLRLIRRLLRNSILSVDGEIKVNEMGTPQGSPVSPILANIFLHEVLDEWFATNWRQHGEMIRYADDAIFIFEDKVQAEEFKGALKARLELFGVRLNEDKSGIVHFHKKSPKGDIPFLGFVFYWGRQRLVKTVLKVKTAPKKLAAAMQRFKEWIKGYRNREKLSVIWKEIISRLIGHYNYYGVSTNTSKLNHFYYQAIREVFKWLNRRSQKRSFTWLQFQRKLYFNPLPKPPTEFDMIDITQGTDTKMKRKPRSRMREIRTYGSVRSRGRQLPLFT